MSDAVEARAREICIARHIDPDAYVIRAPAGTRAWSYFREVAMIDIERAKRAADPQMELPL
ncbi:hypothetical protein [Bradyrhizobium sp. Bra64]|uniref:hypothetical protein n=1 Tax=Bradyrhizobium sp. Bra64 TaxID=2926009 RepID=UPI002117B1E0|nr:hypothetical protein [Bradyrhizobium sp. Bra64]